MLINNAKHSAYRTPGVALSKWCVTDLDEQCLEVRHDHNSGNLTPAFWQHNAYIFRNLEYQITIIIHNFIQDLAHA